MDINHLRENLTKDDISFLFNELCYCFQKRYQPRTLHEMIDLAYRLGIKNRTPTRLDLILFFMPYSDYMEEQILIHAR
jgi:hypothetical protein